MSTCFPDYVGNIIGFPPEFYIGRMEKDRSGLEDFTTWKYADIWAFGIIVYIFITGDIYPDTREMFNFFITNRSVEGIKQVVNENREKDIYFPENVRGVFPKLTMLIKNTLQYEPNLRKLEF
jgi:hypothetical protein